MHLKEIFSETVRDPGSAARCGILSLPHGQVSTPVFMPVGTAATVKAVSADDLREIGFEIILSNTYHLYLRPGTAVVEAGGGLHRWMGWDRNILTDSGGFQVFSLAPMRKVTEDGVKFRSHIDGSAHLLTPESVVEIQSILGSDIQMQLDVCTKWGTEYREAEKALTITTAWLDRALSAWRRGREGYAGQLFPIVQGNFFKDLRDRSVDAVAERDPPGIAIGGLSVGEPFEVYAEFLAHTARRLPTSKPRYVMGIGTPDFILEAIDQGIDMFDCVFPTRTARNGLAFTRFGPMAIKKEKFEFDFGPLDPNCACKVCRTYTRSYLRHLFRNGEILAAMLMSYHNLHFLNALVADARAAIAAGEFRRFKDAALAAYREGAR
jgi:queuine tRNA-ribosyltransferase